MTSTKALRLPLALVAVAAMAIFGFLAIAQGAVSSLGIDSATTVPGGTVTVDVHTSASAPGIGAYNIDVKYNASLVTLTGCTSKDGPCNPAFASDTARLVGANANGTVGDVSLGTLTFQAGNTPGVANLTVTINQIADPVGDNITGVTAGNGTITIVAATPTPSPSPTPVPGTATATASPTATAKSLPQTGGSPDGGSDMTAYFLAALGLVVVSGGVWAVARSRR